MKKISLIVLVCAVALCSSSGAADVVFNNEAVPGTVIQLDAPGAFQTDLTLYDALRQRHSSRDFNAGGVMTIGQLSRILWAAYGINRQDGSMLTVPSAHNRQDLTVYVVAASSVWVYDNMANTLTVAPGTEQGDFREPTGMQDYVKDAAITLVYVSNQDKMSDMTDEPKVWSAFHAGNSAQSVALVCVAEGLKNVVRASIDPEAIAKILNLSGNSVVLMTQSVGP